MESAGGDIITKVGCYTTVTEEAELYPHSTIDILYCEN
jgi:hypothetical protein